MELLVTYDDAHDPKYGAPVTIPLKIATKETLTGYGNLVPDFKKENCKLLNWPVFGRRKLFPGSGVQVHLRENEFKVVWSGDRSFNLGSNYTTNQLNKPTSRLQKGDSADKRTYTLVRQATYHPDSEQVIYPRDGQPFVMHMALPGEDVTPEAFTGFYFDGTSGINIHPFVWHQSPIPIADESVYLNKNGVMHAQVKCDMVDEFGKYLRVPLDPNMAE